MRRLEFARRPVEEPSVTRPFEVLGNVYDMEIKKDVYQYSVQFVPDLDTRNNRNERIEYVNKRIRPLNVKFRMILFFCMCNWK
jgi:hypothetical protein